MSRDTPTERKSHTTLAPVRALWLWFGGSALGISVGAGLALSLSRLGLNPTGVAGWHPVVFGLAIGIPFGLSQWSVRRHVLKYRTTTNDRFLHLWIPVTIAGVVVTLLLLGQDSVLGIFPFAAVLLFLPSMALFGLGQWFLLRQLIGGSLNWVLMTMVGAASGSLFGLVIAWAAQPIPGEFIWIFMTGAGIGLFQAVELFNCLIDEQRVLKEPGVSGDEFESWRAPQ
jgi:hypothetical protein